MNDYFSKHIEVREIDYKKARLIAEKTMTYYNEEYIAALAYDLAEESYYKAKDFYDSMSFDWEKNR